MRSFEAWRDVLTLATCRADPNSTAPHAHVPLPAGHYHVARVERVPARGKQTCGCRTCVDGGAFESRGHAPLPEGPVAIVVHGFNCSEQSGIETALHIRNALAAWGVPVASPEDEVSAPPAELRVIGFTWPCEHSLTTGYAADKEAVARFAAFSLANLITDLRRAEPERSVAVVAHSMGCFLTLKALNMLAVLHAGDMTDQRAPLVDAVMWLAPDINADAPERSTPAATRARLRYRLRERLPLGRVGGGWRRPVPLAPSEAAPLKPASDEAHPLDGYGYDAVGAVRHVAIYCSLRDEALWISPFANRITEEAGAAAGNIRLGWCGPLHPGLVVAPDRDDRVEHRAVTLVDCTPIVSEHGDYFFHPVAQRDIAARLTSELDLRAPALTPPPERQPLATWHSGAPLQFPPMGVELPQGLTLDELRATPPPGDEPTAPRDGAPVADSPLSRGLARLWHSPFALVPQAMVDFWRWYYRV